MAEGAGTATVAGEYVVITYVQAKLST
jgi:hypothetical protein